MAADPMGPRITYYDDATGERIELSTVTLANWAAKTGNLLRDEMAAGPGSRVAVLLPAHWQSAAVLFGVWWIGAEVVLSGDADIALCTTDRLPDAVVWRCIDEQAGSGRPQIDLAAAKCASTCTAAERDTVDKKALSKVPSYTTKDATTRYAERTEAGKYLLTVNHTFAINGQNWVLLIDAEASKAEHKPGVQKTVNDIWSQTP